MRSAAVVVLGCALALAACRSKQAPAGAGGSPSPLNATATATTSVSAPSGSVVPAPASAASAATSASSAGCYFCSMAPSVHRPFRCGYHGPTCTTGEQVCCEGFGDPPKAVCAPIASGCDPADEVTTCGDSSDCGPAPALCCNELWGERTVTICKDAEYCGGGEVCREACRTPRTICPPGGGGCTPAHVRRDLPGPMACASADDCGGGQLCVLHRMYGPPSSECSFMGQGGDTPTHTCKTDRDCQMWLPRCRPDSMLGVALRSCQQ